MTKKERLIVSCYTGVLMVEWDEFLEYTEKLLNRPILAKEVETEEFVEEVINAVRTDFEKLCED